MRNRLAICTALLVVFLVVFGRGDKTPPTGFPSLEQIAAWLEEKSPSELYDSVLAAMGCESLSGNALRAFLNILNEIERSPEPPTRRENVEICRAWLMAVHGYDSAALAIVKRLIDDPVPLPVKRQTDLALIEATIEQRSGDKEAAASAVARLALIDQVAAQALQERLNTLSYTPIAPRYGSKVKIVVLWFVILLIPMAIMEWRRRSWLERFPPNCDRTAPYNALRGSSINLLSTTIGALIVFLFNFPGQLGIPYRFIFAIIHWLLSYSGALFPLYKLDCEIRQTCWSFAAFLKTVLRLHLLRALPLVAPFLAFFTVRYMALKFPWWCIHSPWKPALGFAALCVAILLVLPLTIPYLMGMKRLSSEELPENICDMPVSFYRWDIWGGKIANAVSFGYLRPTYSIAFTADLLENFSSDEIAAVAAHEEAHLVKEHLFIYFLMMTDIALAVGCWSVLYETAAERMLIFGPDLIQVTVIIILGIVLERLFMAVGRSFEFEADEFAASKIGREPYIAVLTHLNYANFLPVRVREGEGAPGLHPSLAERRRALRAREGKVFEPRFDTPPQELILALWRSRLAFEWTRGESEAAHLCALDDDLPSTLQLCERFEKLAERHAAFGSYALLNSSGSKLDIVECRQKMIVKTAEVQIPSDRVCVLCRSGMLEALSPEANLFWRETADGCCLEKQIDES